jgi:two-component system, chemotaxis family, chemotaxis protein CheY
MTVAAIHTEAGKHMIIIDDTAEERLERALIKLAPNPGLSRCIRFDSAAMTTANSERTQNAQQTLIVNAAREYLANDDVQIYICTDGDVFILSSNLPGKAARLFMESVAFQCASANVDDIAIIYQLAQQMSAVRYHVDAKLENIRARLAVVEEQTATQRVKRTRQAILNPDVKPQEAENITARRRQRSAPELMLIEDDSFSSRLVSNVLQRQYHLTILDDTYMALRTYVQLAPDILFLDIGLPNVTGHELLERILALDPDACVVMLSSSADRVNVMRAMERGAKGFIAKPFTREKIMQYIERCPSIKRPGESHENPRH